MVDKQYGIKRRRLNEAASALSRPFKSPLRKDSQQNHLPAKDTRNVQVHNCESTEECLTSDSSVLKQTSESSPHEPTPSTGPSAFNNKRFKSSHSNSTPSRHQRISLKTDPELAALQKEQNALQSRLASLRSQLDTAQQALRIESSPRDEELQGLITKWKKVSQNAADELFVSAKDKIERMGGVEAWRERETMRKMQMMKWDDDDEVAEDFESEATSITTPSATAAAAKEEQNVFTMDMMLESLNIDLSIIGFDKVDQKWITTKSDSGT